MLSTCKLQQPEELIKGQLITRDVHLSFILHFPKSPMKRPTYQMSSTGKQQPVGRLIKGLTTAYVSSSVMLVHFSVWWTLNLFWIPYTSLIFAQILMWCLLMESKEVTLRCFILLVYFDPSHSAANLAHSLTFITLRMHSNEEGL